MFNSTVLPRALALARSLRPHFVLGHSHYAALTTYRCRRDLGIPSGLKLFGVMDLVHTEWPRWKYFFKNFEQIAALRHPQDAWIVLDDGTRGDRVLASRGLPEDRIFFLPNGVNLEWQEKNYDGTATRAELGIGEDSKVVLFLARFVASKRPEEVISIIPRVNEKTGGRVKFVFAGDGPERASCEALVKRLGVSAAAQFIGIVPHSDVPRIMAASDLFVTTSSLTNMAIPTCEAFICGLPVAAYDTGDTNKVVLPGETGALAGDGDRDQLADAVVSLLEDEGELKRMGDNARRFARENFTGWDERIRMELDIINRLIS
jgi:glycosyltransferase involved in cell wall biosynthesis